MECNLIPRFTATSGLISRGRIEITLHTPLFFGPKIETLSAIDESHVLKRCKKKVTRKTKRFELVWTPVWHGSWVRALAHFVGNLPHDSCVGAPRPRFLGWLGTRQSGQLVLIARPVELTVGQLEPEAGPVEADSKATGADAGQLELIAGPVEPTARQLEHTAGQLVLRAGVEPTAGQLKQTTGRLVLTAGHVWADSNSKWSRQRSEGCCVVTTHCGTQCDFDGRSHTFLRQWCKAIASLKRTLKGNQA